jgi:hypothetical protein
MKKNAPSDTGAGGYTRVAQRAILPRLSNTCRATTPLWRSTNESALSFSTLVVRRLSPDSVTLWTICSISASSRARPTSRFAKPFRPPKSQVSAT